VDDFEEQWRAFAAALGELRDEHTRLNAKAITVRLDRSEQRRRDAVEDQINDMQAGVGDYYPLAWPAQRGFLPTYAFP
jgi:hypothetical protein